MTASSAMNPKDGSAPLWVPSLHRHRPVWGLTVLHERCGSLDLDGDTDNLLPTAEKASLTQW